MKNNQQHIIGYSRGTQDERKEQNERLKHALCSSIIEDPDQSNDLCPALQPFSALDVTLVITNLNVLRGSQSFQLSWLRKWLLKGNQIITLDGVFNSIQWPEATSLIAALTGHNPRAKHAPAGRPRGLSDKALQLKEQAKGMYAQKKLNSSQCARRLGIARSTYYRYLNLKPATLPQENQE